MLIYRLHRSVRTAGDYTGAVLAGGRWNPPGTAMLYATQHLSLACLEVFVHLDKAQLPPEYVWSTADRGQLEFGRGQLKLPKAGKAKAIQVGDDLYGERSAGKTTLAAVRAEIGLGDCGRESRHGPENGTQVPARSAPAKRDATEA
jgi:RES domain-containing protein